jgi:hypothetical protein
MIASGISVVRFSGMFLKSNLLVEQLANRRSNNSKFMWNFNCKIKVSLTINLHNYNYLNVWINIFFLIKHPFLKIYIFFVFFIY